jgi:hypothetical protein
MTQETATDRPASRLDGGLVERLQNVLERCATSPAFGADMALWSELAGTVQEAMRTLTALTRPLGEGEEELVERVARAIYDADESAIKDLPFLSYDKQREYNGDDWMLLKRARAAIAAFRSTPPQGEETSRLRGLLDYDFGDESAHCIALAEAAGALLSTLSTPSLPIAPFEEWTREKGWIAPEGMRNAMREGLQYLKDARSALAPEEGRK